MSLVEIGAALQIPVGVARVLVSDLAGAGYVPSTSPNRQGDDGRPRPPCSNACWRVYVRADRKTYIPLKIVIAGGFGVGKTTMVRHCPRSRRSSPRRR